MLSLFSRVRLFATPWTVAHQAPLCMGFSRQDYWSGLPFPTPGNHPNPGIKPMSLVSYALADGFFTNALPGKPIPLNSTNSSTPGVAPTAAGSNFMGSDESHQYSFLK